MLVKFVFLRSEVCWKWLRSTQDLEHASLKIFLSLFVLTQVVKHQLTKLGEINEPISSNSVGDINHLLVRRIQTYS